MALRILAFEPFDVGSHRAVRESIARHARHEWCWTTRPGRAWKWRMRLAAIEMVDAAAARGLLHGNCDAIVATSLMSVADLRAMLPSRLRERPMVLYMHENQAAYPAGFASEAAAARDVHFALTNLTSVLSADLVIWNSGWNQQSFIEGIDALLRRAPDGSIGDVRERIEARSRVIWPPVEPPPADMLRTDADPAEGILHNAIRVAWPHRWEHDKGVEMLLELATRESEDLNLRWTLLGEQFSDVPPALQVFQDRLASRIDHAGFEPDRSAYWRRLAACDWVLSTARHEFFGIAVVEAMLAGCLPWLPDRLSYPELLPREARDLSPRRPPRDPEAVRRAIARHLEPCVAPNAVRAIEESIEALISA
ncbi:MAG: tRNA-queuosine alpha-mannosyltransferase domain-containing protein [Planctomycetota bacterium]|jgi:glycosyltransferase involved in cell wall biosynthesis